MTQAALTLARVLAIPTPRDIWEIIKVNERVAIAALICATIVGALSVVGVVVVAVMGGDFSALALAISGLLVAVISRLPAKRNGGNGNGDRSSP